MRRWFLGATFFLATLGICPAEGAQAGDVNFDIGLKGGYRLDELDWNIAGTAGSPDILSELTWRDLEIYQIGAAARIVAGRPGSLLFAHGRALADYGWITDGKNQDSDYGGDGRTLEWSRSINDAGDGEVYDLSVGGGPGFHIFSGQLTVAPLVGYSYHRQNLTMRDGFQILSSSSTLATGQISGLDSTYEAEWWGPWTGVDLCWRPLKRLTLSGRFEYHWADYDAKARWNLRTDLAQPVSFTHETDGSGIVFAFGVDSELSAAWAVGVEASYQDWETDRGSDRIFFADGSTSATRLNEVNWESATLMIEVNYRFF